MIAKANVQDAKQVYEIIRKHAAKSALLPRPLVAVYEHIRDFFVYRVKGKIRGIVALHIVWEDMAEVRSLVVDVRHRKKGIGRKLVEKTLEEAGILNIPNVFALTREEAFFKHIGFKRVAKNKLPQKVWKDCINCPLFPDCDEVPVIFRLKNNAGQK